MKKPSSNYKKQNRSKPSPQMKLEHKKREAQSKIDSQKKTDKAPRFASDKNAFPKNWRQVAGTHAIIELLRVRAKSVQVVLLQTNWRSSADLRELTDLLNTHKIKIEEKSDQQLQEISRSHQGAIAFSNHNLDLSFDQLTTIKTGLVLALDGVEDTQNLGAILRTSWLMGASGVIIPEDRAVGLTATVHKVACGGAEHVPIHRANQFATPFETLKKAGYWVFGLSHKAEKSIYDLKIPDKVVWVLGAEDKGLRNPTEKACDELVSIPQTSPLASYNVSVSAALALAETKRQWALKKG
jgi:23S rRNA (guanosine2251-2'-O)-methyltransferase